METGSAPRMSLPPQQKVIRSRCFHPSGGFTEFQTEDVEQSVVDQFEKIAGRYPERIAIKTSNHRLTYTALNEFANRIAWTILENMGMGPEPIALLVENDAPSIAAMLGTMKAGKSYVPLDPGYPYARLASIMKDVEARLILTDSNHAAMATALSQDKHAVLKIEDLHDGGTNNLRATCLADAFASIFYTSGSTGEPKGVIQSHRNVLHRAMVDINNFHICPDDRLSLVTSPGYSGSLRLFGPLLSGATVYLFSIEEEGLGRLADSLIHEEITLYYSVPTVFRYVTTCSVQFDTIRLIYLSGEPTTRADVESYKRLFSADCVFVNSLASNEAGIIRQYFIDKETELTERIVPAGYEVAGKQILVMNDEGLEAHGNRIGEIAVKSRYLSPGYWRKPDLNRTVFFPDPAGGEDRIYRTGDLGRLLPDGCLTYLGRKGSGVKVRGARVELDEIEGMLRAHPAVKEAIAQAVETESTGYRLIAYVVPVPSKSPSVSELRLYLQAQLPHSMIPSGFVFLEALPLTSTGKVNRQKLPRPCRQRPHLDNPFAPAETPIQRILAGIWQEILGLEQIGINDNFLELGGDSLMATRIVSRVIEQFGIELPPQSLLATPTVAAMAMSLAAAPPKPSPPAAESPPILSRQGS